MSELQVRSTSPSGFIDTEELYKQRLAQGADPEWAKRDKETQEAHWRELESKVSPVGVLGLDSRLDQVRFEQKIPDAAFRTQASFDRVYLHQLPDNDELELAMKGGLISRTETNKTKARYEASRGIVISAGLYAMDVLRTNGFRLGDVVAFLRLSPYRHTYDTIAGKEQNYLVLRVGDLTGCEGLRARVREGRAVLKLNDQNQHVYVQDGVEEKPLVPEGDPSY